jgi:hypothetical protein
VQAGAEAEEGAPAMDRKSAWLGLLVVALAALLFAACGGDDKKSGESGSGTSAGTTAQGGSPTARDDSLATTNCLKDVKSYRFEGKLSFRLPSGTAASVGTQQGDFTFSGAFVAPDRSQIKADLAGFSFEQVQIGSDAWTRIGNGGWTKSAADSSGGFSFTPESFCESNLTELNKAGVKPTRDKVNGVNALKYEFDRNALNRLNDLFGNSDSAADLTTLPDNTKLTLWVTEKERWPVRMTLTGDGKVNNEQLAFNMQFNVTDINKDIKIEAPR